MPYGWAGGPLPPHPPPTIVGAHPRVRPEYRADTWVRPYRGLGGRSGGVRKGKLQPPAGPAREKFGQNQITDTK
jgi:hypothetical protein